MHSNSQNYQSSQRYYHNDQYLIQQQQQQQFQENEVQYFNQVIGIQDYQSEESNYQLFFNQNDQQDQIYSNNQSEMTYHQFQQQQQYLNQHQQNQQASHNKVNYSFQEEQTCYSNKQDVISISEDSSCQDKTKSQIISYTSIHNSFEAQSSTCISSSQICLSNQPQNSVIQDTNLRESSTQINGFNFFQESLCEDQNSQQIPDVEQSYSNQFSSSSKSHSSPSTFKSSTPIVSQPRANQFSNVNNGQKSNTLSDADNENRRIIQTYQKISKININKNIIKAFKKFMLDKDNSLSSFGITHDSKNSQKQMKIFFDSLNHNNHSVTKIIDHPLYGGAFEFFLTFNAESWLQSSRVQDKQAHFIAIDFFKLCCTENKYYSKRKTESSNKNCHSLLNKMEENSDSNKQDLLSENQNSQFNYDDFDNKIYSEQLSCSNL